MRLTIVAGYPPTLREMAVALGCTWRGAHDLLVRMRDLGLVEWQSYKSRTLRAVTP